VRRLTQLRQAASAKAQGAPLAVAAPGAVPSVYVVYDPRDSQLVLPWSEYLFQQQLEVVHPHHPGNDANNAGTASNASSLGNAGDVGDEREVREAHEESLRMADGVVLFYGAASEAWLRRKLTEIQKSPGYGRTKPPPEVVICLVAPRTPLKERFRTHYARVVPQWDGCDAASLEPFVTALAARRSESPA
jgi:hypothetical protein